MVFVKNLKWSSTVKKWSLTPKKWSSTTVELHFFKKVQYPLNFTFIIHLRALSGWWSEFSLGLIKVDDDYDDFSSNEDLASMYLCSSSFNFSSRPPRPSPSSTWLRLVELGLGLGGLEWSKRWSASLDFNLTEIGLQPKSVKSNSYYRWT